MPLNKYLLELHKIFKQFPKVSTDSRNILKDSLFFALKGENFNGNKYANDAIKKGCKYAIIDEVDSGHDFYIHTTPHNQYLYVWFELGIFGLILLLLIFYHQIKDLLEKKDGIHRVLLPISFIFFSILGNSSEDKTFSPKSIS